MADTGDAATIALLRGALIEIATETARVGILPNIGGALAYYDLYLGGHWHPILRRMSPRSIEPTDAAMIVLAPWSNRISGGGFRHDGKFHALKPNIPGERYPIHGNAFQSVWLVDQATDQATELLLESSGPGPYDYAASLKYRLTGSTLGMTLTLTHRGDQPLPYGAGFHPWFPRTPKTRLTAPALTVRLENADHLPAGEIAVAERPSWDFNQPHTLPANWINSCFANWPGIARIDWPERRLSLDIAASDNLMHYLIYAPGSEIDFFCFEPVSHPVDAHNHAEDTYLRVLRQGQKLSISLQLHPGLLSSQR